MGEIDQARQHYAETIKLDLARNREIHPGAVEDLKELIKKNIMAEEARKILAEIFGISNQELGN